MQLILRRQADALRRGRKALYPVYKAIPGLSIAAGTPLGHSRRYPLISLNYFRDCIATVERREASVPLGASQAPDTPRYGMSNGCLARTRTSLGAPPTPRLG
jgi:hypothetical protein